MDSTPRLALPCLLPNQTQKHVTVNEALKALDVMTGLSVHSRTVAAQPGSRTHQPCSFSRAARGYRSRSTASRNSASTPTPTRPTASRSNPPGYGVTHTLYVFLR
jgi:hypothetical protein